MKLSLTFVAALFAVSASAAAIERASTKCHTVHKGDFTVSPYTATPYLTLNSKKQVTYGSGKKLPKVNFQSCPTVGANYPEDDQWTGRITVGSDCLTVSNPTSKTPPFFVKLAKCTSDTKPSVGQTWTWGTSDDRGVVYWNGNDVTGSHIGYWSTTGDKPKLEKNTKRLQLGCTGQGCSTINLRIR